MKKILGTMLILIATNVQAQQQVKPEPYFSISGGYGDDHYSVMAANFGINITKEDALLYPFVETGGVIQFAFNDNTVPQTVNFNTGLEFNNDKFFASAKIGGGYSVGRNLEDRQILNDTLTELSKGSGSPEFFSVVYGCRVGLDMQLLGGDAPIFIDVTHVAKFTSLTVGVKCVFGK